MGPDVSTLPSRDHVTSRRRHLATASLLLLASMAMGWLTARSLRRVEVVGGSMAPTFFAGDRLAILTRPFGPPSWPDVGSVVAVPDPREANRILIKRVASVNREAGLLEVHGDDPAASTDSRTFGPVALSSVVGRVVYRYGPAGRSGPGPWPKGYDRP